MAELKDILEIPVSEGRRGLQTAKDIVEGFLSSDTSEVAVKPVRTKPGKVKETTKVVK